MAKQDDYTRYTIRIPTPLYERVKAAAGEKSVNAEIVATLEEKYPSPVGDQISEVIAAWLKFLGEEVDALEANRRLRLIRAATSRFDQEGVFPFPPSDDPTP